MRLHYKISEGETIEYVDMMFIYPYICKYFRFPIGHPVIHAGDDCLDIQQNRNQGCTHETDAESALTLTWVLDAIRLAVQKDYKLLVVHKVYEYQVTQYDPETVDGGLFVEYINTFLKLKAEASGYPNWVHCPEDEVRLISKFHKSEGIQLDNEKYWTQPS
jgi:hypothetical protein